MALLYLMPPIALFFGVDFNLNWQQIGIDFGIVYGLLSLFLLYLMNYLTKLKIGVYGNNVHLYARGKKVVVDFSELRLSSGYLFCAGFVIPVGSGRIFLFDKVEFEKKVLSQINTDNYFSDDNANKLLWKLKEPLFVSALMLIFILFVFW